MMKNCFLMITAIAVLTGITGCSSLIRQNPQKETPQKKTAAPAKKAQPQPAQQELTAAQIAAMTPEQLRKYHAERQRIREQQDAQSRKRLQLQSDDRPASRSLVNSFMSEPASREKRRRLGDVSRQLNYRETSVFPWREGRRSETLGRR